MRIAPKTRLAGVSFGAFSGATTMYRKDGLFWQEWWLRSKDMMVYATYNVVQESEAAELRTVEGILASLTA
jgi:hypothetical protein